MLRRKLNASPNDVKLACLVAGQYLSMGRREGDPRFYGYSRAALRPWWEQENPPVNVLRVRAELREKEHRYDDALVDLRKLLTQQPQDEQAWIEVANILRVQGKYDEAWDACRSLEVFGSDVANAICQIPLQAATGQIAEANDRLTEILPEVQKKFPSVVQWVHTMQAKVAYAMGSIEETERFLRRGLSANPQDKYLLREYADFLLDQDRSNDALILVRDHVADNGILLRAAIAAKQVGEADLAREWGSQLSTRFEEIRLRGGQPHGRFEARFELEVRDDPNRALIVSLANWKQQKETRDTRNVLEAALASDPVAAKPVISFLKEHGTEDAILKKLVNELEVQE